MAPEQPKPIEGNWYKDLDQELLFTVLAVRGEAIEIQYNDGTIETLDPGGWDELALDYANPPETWPADFEVSELGLWDTATHPEGAPRPLDAVEGAEQDLGPQKPP